jgi:predicted nucleic acid-binding protein
MTDALLDTSVLIASDAEAELPPSAAISMITLGELYAGVALARSEPIREMRLGRLDAVRAEFVSLPVDEGVARSYGDLLAFARTQRRREKATDLLIAATAASSGRTLYTADLQQAELARAAGIPVVVR